MESNKQTAIEWLHELFKQRELDKFDWKQAREMEKEQRQLSEEEIDMTAKEYVLYNDQKRDWVIQGMKLYREKLKNK
jgi:uncharacterized glyoxalase superfamily protein PhnB